jgi:hypothetical protein
MSRRLVLSLIAPFVVTLTIHAAEVNGIAFAASPGSSWRCGLQNDDIPGLDAEHMVQPVAAGCERGEVKAYVVIVDLSDSRSPMRAEQMAADAEDQLPSSWKVDTKSYDVVTLSNGQRAAYSRLIGKGTGFTFVTGQKPMVAISLNVPLLFEDGSGKTRQAIAVFRARAALPSVAPDRKAFIADLDRTVREWAGSAAPASGHAISERDFELAAYARTKGITMPAAASVTASQPQQDPLPAAVAALMNHRATSDDLATLEKATSRASGSPLAKTVQSYIDEAERSADEQTLAAILDAAKEDAPRFFSRFLATSASGGDADGLAVAARVAQQRGWSLRNATPDAIGIVVRAITAHTVSLAPESRAFFELPANEIAPLAPKPLPHVTEIAKPSGQAWRLRDRRGASRDAFLVCSDNGVGLLERQPDGMYRLRLVTNVLDLASGSAPPLH